MSRVMPVTGAFAAVLLAVLPVQAQVTSDQDSAASPWPTVGGDPDFGGKAAADTADIRRVMQGNATEIELGKLGESRADDDDVEEFAERIVSEHESMSRQWGALAKSNGMKAEVRFGKPKAESVERLGKLSESEFDQAFMSEMIRLHEQDLAAFEGMQTSAPSPEVRELARSAVPTIREHLALARQVGSRVGVSTTAARTGGVTRPKAAPLDTARRDPRPLGTNDRAFVEDILSDHLLHIRLARRAQREARKDDTRDLAERIEKDFTHWEARWQRVAARHDADLESRLERVDRRKIDHLEEATRRGFDRTYGAIVAERLESLLRDFRKVGQESKSAAVRRLVEEETPVIREDLQRARRLHEQMTR